MSEWPEKTFKFHPSRSLEWRMKATAELQAAGLMLRTGFHTERKAMLLPGQLLPVRM